MALVARREKRNGTPKTPEAAIFNDSDDIFEEVAHENGVRGAKLRICGMNYINPSAFFVHFQTSP
jgi:hypothetical protein